MSCSLNLAVGLDLDACITLLDLKWVYLPHAKADLIVWCQFIVCGRISIILYENHVH